MILCAFKKFCARGDEKAKAQKKKKEKSRKSDARGTAREADVQWHKSRVMDHTADKSRRVPVAANFIVRC